MKSLKIIDISINESNTKVLESATNDQARFELTRILFNEQFGVKPEAMACAGGRVNLIGEHVDYPDVQFTAGDNNNNNPAVHLFSMGGAIQNNYIAAGSKRTDEKLIMVHLECYQRLELDLVDLPVLESKAVLDRENATPKAQRTLPSWTVHSLGAVKEMLNRGIKCNGLNLILTSNVPHGAGMSNSAANCVALGLVFNALYPELLLLKNGMKINLVSFARQSENSKFAGGQCGWLDQLLIVNSKANMLTKIDYANNGIEHFVSKLPNHTMQFVAFNTNVPHVLAESDYGHRVRELTLGIQFLSKHLRMNAGGPNFKLATLNALIMAMDPTIPVVTIPDALKNMDGINGEDDVSEFDSVKIKEIVDAINESFEIPTDLPMHRNKSAMESFAIILRRMRHQKMSSLLVPLAGEAAAKGDSKLFGLLLDLEGQSLRMSGDFMITGDNGAQDMMLDCAFRVAKDLGLQGQVHGRMLGGGGGGNVLLYVNKSNKALFTKWEQDTITAYNKWAESTYPNQNILATVITPVISSGASLVNERSRC